MRNNDFRGPRLAFPAGSDQETPPYDGNLYPTLLAGSPKSNLSRPHLHHIPMNTLTQAQKEKLYNITIPQHLQLRNHQSPISASSIKIHLTSPPDHHDRSRKCKSSAEAKDKDEEDSHPPVKKPAHNMIEKRYRKNLNDKIAVLRDSVPSLRIMIKSARGEDTIIDRGDLQGLRPTQKLNKGIVSDLFSSLPPGSRL